MRRTGSGGRRAAAALLLVAAGCARPGEGGDAAAPPPTAENTAPLPRAPSPSGSGAAAGEEAPDTAGAAWTAGVVDRRRPEVGTTVLEEVRAGRNEGFDRVVFRFSGGELPGYRLEYVDRPVRQCGSGHATEVAGEGWLTVRFEPSRAHDDEGRATVRDRERALDLPVLKELESICDFEGQVEWVLGLASPNRYRVLELRDPARVVVDVRH